MFTFKSPKVESFTVELDKPLSLQDVNRVLENAVCNTVLPDKSPFTVPLAGLLEVEATDNPQVFNFTPNRDAIDAQAVKWCQALTKLPHKSLPRSQRPVIKLLQRLPELPTGNAAHDKGRRAIIDQTLFSLWPTIKNATSESLKMKTASLNQWQNPAI